MARKKRSKLGRPSRIDNIQYNLECALDDIGEMAAAKMVTSFQTVVDIIDDKDAPSTVKMTAWKEIRKEADAWMANNVEDEQDSENLNKDVDEEDYDILSTEFNETQDRVQ